MKKFVFRLEKVLQHKQRLYDIAWGKHAEAQCMLAKEEEKLQSLQGEYKTCLYELSEKTRKNFHIRELGPFYRFMTFTKREIAYQNHVVAEALEKEELLRQELMCCAQEKEALVKLKNKQETEYMEYVRKEEQKFLDDITTAKYTRQVRG